MPIQNPSSGPPLLIQSSRNSLDFVSEFPGQNTRFMKLKLPKNCAAHYQRMKNRPAVQRVLDQEGLSAAA
jgi:hypothetical protein